MRDFFYGLLALMLFFGMWNGIAFKVTVNGEPTIIEVDIGVVGDEEQEKQE